MKTAPTTSIIRRKIQSWFRTHRRDLPWRRTRDPYLIAVSEVMLQQTQVDRVRPKFLAWKKRWPTTAALAKASLHEVLMMWSGLGYNSRGKRLRDAARAVMQRFDGRWPRHIDELESLPGFGPYTARAVASFAYNADTAVIDTNVRRVLSRIFFGVQPPPRDELEEVVDTILPRGSSADWNAALMDFGSAVCTSRSPRCQVCPVQNYCRAYPSVTQITPRRQAIKPRFVDTDRYLRGAIIRALLTTRTMTVSMVVGHLSLSGRVDKDRVVRLLRAMVDEGVVTQEKKTFFIAA